MMTPRKVIGLVCALLGFVAIFSPVIFPDAVGFEDSKQFNIILVGPLGILLGGIGANLIFFAKGE